MVSNNISVVIYSLGVWTSPVHYHCFDIFRTAFVCSHKLQTVKIAQTIELSQELWEKLAWWNMDFSIIDRDVKFVDAALKTIGYVNGLNGIFSKEQIVAIGNERYAAILDLLS